MAMTGIDDRLPCGMKLDTLAAQVADDANDVSPVDAEHQARCPYCQTALTALNQARDDLHALAREPIVLPPRLTKRIMAPVRELAARMATNLILATRRGQTRISHIVIARIARRVALTVPGVLFASAQIAPGHSTEPTTLTLTLRLVIAFGPAAPALADTVRATIQQRLPRLTGAGITSIDITIDDIGGPEA